MEAQGLEYERRLEKAQGDEALKYAISAAELYMKAAAKAKTPAERSRLNRKFTELIGLGERLKANAKAAAAASRPPVPESTRILTTSEKTILLKASRLHGNVFPPWDSAPGPDHFSDTAVTGDSYIDPSPFSLSAEQQAIFAGWKRPSELVPRAKDGDAERGREQFMAATAEPDLAQDLATDCSVVASLCAASRHLGPTKGSLLASLMYPFDHDAMIPKVSKNGKYVFRMYFNGSWRKVTIDDRLPASSTDRTLYVVDRRNPKLIWPALVEKAYLKIRGGYDFPGSNSGTDLHALTGWIPEQIFLQSDDIELDEIWSRINKAYDEGNAILTLGTGNMLPEEERALGLVKEHDYAVLDLKRDESYRLLLIKNPWIDSLVWTGVGSSATLKAHTVGSTSDNASNQFWMAFEDVIQHFDSLYVNWNPALFTHRQDHHFKWEMPDKTEELVYTHNPQYSVLSPSSGPIWVLLSRHWQDGELDILRERKAEKDRGDASLANVSKQLGFMALALFATSPPGTRVPLPDDHRRLHQGPYVDSPNTVLRYNPTPNVPQTLVVAQGELPFQSYSFTLSFFSSSPLTISPAPEPLPYNTTLSGSWTRRSAGGSAAHPTYLANPQWSLTAASPTPLSLVLSTDARDLPIHIALLFSPGGCRITSVQGRDIVASSAEYQRGCTAVSVASLDGGGGGGTYTIVASTFEPNQLGNFALRVSSAVPVTVRPVAPDAAGRLRTPVPGPPAVFAAGQARLRARVTLARLTRLGALTSATSPTGLAVRVALELGTGPHRSVLALSRDGEFADASMGLRTDEVDVEPEVARSRGGLWLVLEQISGVVGGSMGGRRGDGSSSGVQVEVLSDAEVHVGGWEGADED
ncbi:cysteine protease [Madurella fahalii]|uniref:Cysteine protease n=1 Tax=Madurella fahalii TaxID=1157608 RepID=A0ABQ0GRU2_9PEZI